jgi:hypothetical protein
MQLLLGFAREVTLGSKFHRTRDHILLSRLRLLQPGGNLRNRVAQALGPLFIASYKSQGYGGGILDCLHKGST